MSDLHSNKFTLKNILIISFFFCETLSSFCQQKTIDSLKQVLKSASHDSTRCNILNNLIEAEADSKVWSIYNEQLRKLAEANAKTTDKVLRNFYLNHVANTLNNIGYLASQQGNIPEALEYYQRALKMQEDLGDKNVIAASLSNIGAVYQNQGDILKALDYFEKSLGIQEEIGYKVGIANSLNNIGFIYQNQGDIVRALEYYSRSLKIQEEIGDKQGGGNSLINIGSIYLSQGDQTKALDCFLRSLVALEKIGYNEGIAISLNNIGFIHKSKGDNSKALYYYKRSLKVREDIGDKQGISNSLNNIGFILSSQTNLPAESEEWFKSGLQALDYFGKSLQLQKEIGYKRGIASSQSNIGLVYFQQKKYSLALSFLDSSLVLAKELGFPEIIQNAEKLLSKIDSALGNFSGAFEHYQQYIIYHDSISNAESRKASIRNQLNYEFEKKEAVMKEQQEKSRVVSEERNRRLQIIIWSVAFGFVLVIIFAGFIFRSLKTSRKQKIIIEVKQLEILDSIHYAKRIQTALITNEKYIDKTLNRLNKV